MEKRKLLLIAISVGLFLVITIGAALVVFAPKGAPPSSAVAGRPAGQTGITVDAQPYYQPPASSVSPVQETPVQSAPLDPVDLVRASDVPGLQTPPAGQDRQDNGFFISGSAQTGQEPATLITVPRPSSAAVPDTPPAGRAVAAAAPAARPPAAAPAQTRPAQTAAPAPARPTQTRTYTDYWVQTGAFSTIARAEGVKENLSSKGITSIIENREVEGNTVFRVRVGPYTSQNEADYWLSLIRSIDGFENSQVRVTQAQR